MIKTINIKKFKGIENLEIPFENFNIFYGPNGIGKSRTLSFIKQVLTLEFQNEISGEIEFIQDEVTINFDIEWNEGFLSRLIVKTNVNNTKSSKLKEIFNLEQEFQSVRHSISTAIKSPITKLIFNPSIDYLIQSLKVLEFNNVADLLEKFNSRLIFDTDKYFVSIYRDRQRNFSSYENRDYRFINELNKRGEINERYHSRFVSKKEIEEIEKSVLDLQQLIKQFDRNLISIEVRKREFGDDQFDYRGMKFNFKGNFRVLIDDVRQVSTNFSQMSKGFQSLVFHFHFINEYVLNKDKILVMDEFDPYLNDSIASHLMSKLKIRSIENSQFIGITHHTYILKSLSEDNLTDFSKSILIMAYKSDDINNTEISIQKLKPRSNSQNLENMYRKKYFYEDE